MLVPSDLYLYTNCFQISISGKVDRCNKKATYLEEAPLESERGVLIGVEPGASLHIDVRYLIRVLAKRCAFGKQR